MCSVDFDPADIFRVRAHRSRKRRHCDECGVDILPGESYARADWLADGSWSSSDRCALCYFLAEAIETLECGDGGTILWGGQCLADEIDYLGPGWWSEAFAAIQDRVFDARGASI